MVTKTVTVGNTSLHVQELSISRSKVWSENTGRVKSGKMQGKVITRKWKLTCKLAPMSESQSQALSNAVESAWINVTFRNPMTGENKTIEAYAGDVTYPVYSYHSSLGKMMYVGATVNFIER